MTYGKANGILLEQYWNKMKNPKIITFLEQFQNQVVRSQKEVKLTPL